MTIYFEKYEIDDDAHENLCSDDGIINQVQGGMLGPTYNINLAGRLVASASELCEAERILYTACELAGEWPPVCWYIDKYGKWTELVPVTDTNGVGFPE